MAPEHLIQNIYSICPQSCYSNLMEGIIEEPCLKKWPKHFTGLYLKKRKTYLAEVFGFYPFHHGMRLEYYSNKLVGYE